MPASTLRAPEFVPDEETMKQRRRLSRIALVGGGVALSTLSSLVALAQQGPHNPYATVSLVAGPYSERPRRTLEDLRRRERVVARAGDAIVAVGDIEDALANGGPRELEQYRTPEGRREFVLDLLRHAALAREAERRGLAGTRVGYAAERAAGVAATDLMIALDYDVRGFEREDAVPAAAAPAERRRAVALESTDRATVAQWLSSVEGTYYERAMELAEGTERGRTIDTDWIAAEETDGALGAELRRAVFAIASQGATTTPIEIAPGRFVGAVLVGVDPGTAPPAEAEVRRQAAWTRRQEALAGLMARLRREHVALEQPEALVGVQFALPDTPARQRAEGRYVPPQVDSIPVSEVPEVEEVPARAEAAQ